MNKSISEVLKENPKFNINNIKVRRLKTRNTLIERIGGKLGLDSIDKTILENFSNTLLRRMWEELIEKENVWKRNS